MPENGSPDPPAGRVLVVEDDEDLARVVTLNLELAGYDVTHAADGATALEAVQETPPDVVLLDVMMPVMDGWQVLATLKAEERTQDIPVVLLTALAGERDLIRGHLQGAVRYVTKPFEMRELIATVEEAVAPPDEEELAQRRSRVRALLQRLAELDAGRTGSTTVQLSRLESMPGRPRKVPPSDQGRRKLADLTEKQRHLVTALAQGRSARELADELEVSRSNVYATRKRVARKLGVRPEDVGEEARRLGLSP